MYGHLPVPIRKYHVEMVRKFLIENNVNQIRIDDKIKYGTGVMQKLNSDNGELVLQFTNDNYKDGIKFYLDDNRRIKEVYMVV